MSKIKHILIFVLIGLPIALYRFCTRKAFYLSGTFIDKDGTRMWFKTTFCTYGNILPIKSLETQIAAHFGVESVILTSFNRMPFGMVKYVEKEMGIKIYFGKPLQGEIKKENNE